MRVTKVITVTQTGIGKPDYSQEIASGKTRPGFSLKYNQQLGLFGYVATNTVVHPYPVSWVKPALAAGASAHIIDALTGAALPYLLPAGFAATLIETTWNFDQDTEQQLFFDGLLIGIPGYTGGGSPQHVSRIEGYSTLLKDPTASLPHTIDCVVINRGGAIMSGGWEVVVLIEAIGTPPFPTEKTVKCPFCGNQQVVPIVSTVITCANCHQVFLVYSTSKSL